MRSHKFLAVLFLFAQRLLELFLTSRVGYLKIGAAAIQNTDAFSFEV